MGSPGQQNRRDHQEDTRYDDRRIDVLGPNSGNEVLLDTLAESGDVATFVGARDRYIWPTTYNLRRIPIVGPQIVYPISLISRTKVMLTLSGGLLQVGMTLATNIGGEQASAAITTVLLDGVSSRPVD